MYIKLRIKLREMAQWTFLTNHSHVVGVLLAQPDLRAREIADKVGITERAVLKILQDLEDAHVIRVIKEGRRNRYTLELARHLRHPLESHKTVGELFDFLRGDGAPA